MQTFYMAFTENSGDAGGYAIYSTFKAAVDFINNEVSMGGLHLLTVLTHAGFTDDDGHLMYSCSNNDKCVGWVIEQPVRGD